MSTLEILLMLTLMASAFVGASAGILWILLTQGGIG